MQQNFSNIPKIRVVIRKRPISKKQMSRGEKDIVEIPNNQTILVKEQKVKVDLTPYLDQYKFIFDGAFNQISTNQQVTLPYNMKIYLSTIRPLIDAAFDGARVSCFAYGQTGSGKTFTMLGDGKNIRGLYLLAVQDVFNINKSNSDISVSVSFYEIYCGKLYDLLNDRTILHAREDAKNNINIVGLSQRKTESMSQVMNAIEYGTSIRVTAQNSTNVDSSRSHAILQINLRKNKKVHGKISFIDLAGSQRAADHADQTDKQTRIDGAQINKSLLALKQCIRALDQNKHHTPFRGSKLTMVLKDSFVGYCKTVMIANVSPNSASCENTLNTLKYADRVKELKKSMNPEQLTPDYLNDLSKQLMLPRQMVNHQQFNKNQQPKHSQSQHALMKNNYFQSNKEIFSNKKFNIKQQAPSHQHHRNQSLLIDKPLVVRQHRSNSTNSVRLNNLSFQSQQEVYDHLNLRHEEMVQKVIQGEENLLAQHENYVNFSVETAKDHIELLHQADQPGNSIENYLSKLDNKLQSQIEQIYKVKALIQNLKYNLDESKKIQKLYLNINQHQFIQSNQSDIQSRPNYPQSNLQGLNFQYNQFEREFPGKKGQEEDLDLLHFD